MVEKKEKTPPPSSWSCSAGTRHPVPSHFVRWYAIKEKNRRHPDLNWDILSETGFHPVKRPIQDLRNTELCDSGMK